MIRCNSLGSRIYVQIATTYHELQRKALERYYNGATNSGRLRGVTTDRRERPLIVSLTTIPSRLNQKAHLAIASLLDQSLAPNRVILWISDSLCDQSLPSAFHRLKEAGLEIEFCQDIGPHTKLVPALMAYPDAVHVTADDDCLYTQGWLAGLYRAYCAEPEVIHCWRAHRITRDDRGQIRPYSEWDWMAPGTSGPDHSLFQTGVGGVLYPPGSLADEVLNQSVFRTICRSNDDIWFKAMAQLQGTRIKKVRPKSVSYRTVGGSQVEQLWSVNSAANDEQIRLVFEKYDLQYQA